MCIDVSHRELICLLRKDNSGQNWQHWTLLIELIAPPLLLFLETNKLLYDDDDNFAK